MESIIRTGIEILRKVAGIFLAPFVIVFLLFWGIVSLFDDTYYDDYYYDDYYKYHSNDS